MTAQTGSVGRHLAIRLLARRRRAVRGTLDDIKRYLDTLGTWPQRTCWRP
jgi:hypothetical protein